MGGPAGQLLAPVGPRDPPAEELTPAVVDPSRRADLLLRDLRSRRAGLSTAEAARRLLAYGPNELSRQGGIRWPGQLARQLTHPLALLLWAAALLAFVGGIPVLGVAIVAVILLNATLAFVQERQAERAVEALERYLPPRARVLRSGHRTEVAVRELVLGDIVLLREGDTIGADVRLLEGALEVDTSTLTGESVPVTRTAAPDTRHVPLLEAADLVFSGCSCTGGDAVAVVYATGMHTELGRVAALSQQVRTEESPLQREVRRVAWLIALIAVAAGAAFVPVGTLLAGLPIDDAVVFSIGLLVANVPEGLLPTITLALAVGVRQLAHRHALVKRLSAVEALGATSVICTDKTGTLTENRMTPVLCWSAAGEMALNGRVATSRPAALTALAEAAAACNNAELRTSGKGSGDPTEIALLKAAAALEANVDFFARTSRRRRENRFDPGRKLMSTIDEHGATQRIHAKGAPDVLFENCTSILGSDGDPRPLDAAAKAEYRAAVERYASQGLRLLGFAFRDLGPGEPLPERREDAERDLCLLGIIALEDPLRPEVSGAVARCHAAGIRIIVVTGDHGRTATAIARQAGIVRGKPTVVTGAELDLLDHQELQRVLRSSSELIFARSSPEAKLRIADELRAQGHVIAMTGDGVNDAPALRAADVGVAMGRSGTEVAREAATMVLADDNFATIVDAVEEGRRVYTNIRKFILYIFAHAPPEVIPFLVFAVSGGAIPLPLTALQILAIDLGTETLPAVALGRDPAEPGLMEQPPRRRDERMIRRSLLARAWLFLGLISAALVLAGFFFVLLRAGWSPGDAVEEGAPLHHAYLEATTMMFAGIVACQVGTALASRTELAPLRAVGLGSNRLLLWGILFELAFAAVVVYLPAFQSLFGTAGLSAAALAFIAPFPLIVWGADELRRLHLRRTRCSPAQA